MPAMRILITGAGGMLGHDVQSAVRSAGHEPIALTRADCDLGDAASTRDAVRAASPDAVINCAAWTNVDGAETHEDEALAANGTGPGVLAAAAAEAGAWMVHVSTDYVFDGAKRSPYLESDPVAPLSAYGRTKLSGERAIAAAAPDTHTIVRTSWLFGVHGKSFPATMLRLAGERDELTVVDDQIGSPTFTGHLAPALVALAAGSIPGILHVAAAGVCSWCEFARAIVAASGQAASTSVRGITTAEFPTPAPRPAYSVLRSQRGAPELRDWREGLGDYLAARDGAATVAGR
jgi:dTDP-4-dehydrorhamnose reductase